MVKTDFMGKAIQQVEVEIIASYFFRVRWHDSGRLLQRSAGMRILPADRPLSASFRITNA